MWRHTQILLWRLLALVSFALGAVGAVLPVLPTVPFLLLAGWAASRGWPRLEAWMLAHSTYGPAIQRWRARGAVSRRDKWLATALMSMSVVGVLFSPVPTWVKWGVPTLLVCTALWLWRRPEC